MPAIVRIEWDRFKIARIVEEVPRAAHQVALQAAANASAADLRSKIKHGSTGQLAADVSKPKEVTSLSGGVGSNRVYAAIQQWGGTIRPVQADRLLIHGIDVTGTDFASSGSDLITGSFVPGRRIPGGFDEGRGGQFAARDVVASALEVTLEGKHYLEIAAPTYEQVLLEALRALFPR